MIFRNRRMGWQHKHSVWKHLYVRGSNQSFTFQLEEVRSVYVYCYSCDGNVHDSCVSNMVISLNLITENVVNERQHNLIKPAYVRNLKSASSESVCFLAIITSHMNNGNHRVPVYFGVGRDLVVSILLGSTFVDRFFKCIFQSGRNVVT